ncbi:hypothetical protein Acr_00g0052790 [Actinidia rufa]|uniref:Uncharacterized protein n=2 Tax=Actinidia rufa TaxID=165716 RepID=A0A7J0DL66_9ERIC|nr:hypothetical protein Acr_00g0052790 [Actinidia rufa]
MDREQEEMQFLGLFGIYLDWAPVDTRRYQKLSDAMLSERIYFWLFKIAYFTFLLIFSLLSTSAVVYTIASIYTAREVTFRKVMSVVPRVWKRLMVTFLCAFATFFLYHIVAGVILFMWLITIADTSVAGPVAFIIFLILYAIGFVYLSVVWQLGSVVTVLEESYGFRAMIKSKNLIKGKMWIAIIIFFKLNLSLLVIQYVFEIFVVNGWSISALGRLGLGILCLFLLFKLFLFGLVIQTVIYFVCKSYHHENINKSALSDHLEVYVGEYERLKPKDVQLEQAHV